MRLAHWIECDPPSPAIKAGLVQLCEHIVAGPDDLHGPVEYYVHSSAPLALAYVSPDSWFMTKTDRWDGDERREFGDRRGGIPHLDPPPEEDQRDAVWSDRRDRSQQEAELKAFLDLYGNGDAE